jgi:hypothetical protein
MHRNFMVDAQQALGFLVSQTSFIEPQVIETVYPDIQYPALIPVDTSAPEWSKSVTYYSMNKVGQAGWFHHMAKDLHHADVERAKYEIGIEMADIGYMYTLEELGQAMMVPGTNLTTDRAAAARRAYEEMVEEVALQGDAQKNFSGIINYPGITAVMAASTGSGGESEWATKTADEILTDVNAILSGVYTNSKQTEMADTLLLPVASLLLIATKRVPDTQMTVLDFLQTKNVYTFTTGRPLTIRAVRGLETAGTGDTGRMVAYRRDPNVLKMHIPMPHRFLPVWQTGPMRFDIPGIFRLGGLEVRRPASVRYLDGISSAAYE